MSAKSLCLGAALLGATVAGCSPSSQNDSNDTANSAASSDNASGAGDVALEIALNQFPGGYQARWAQNAAACADDPETSAAFMSLQGRLIKLPNSIGTMVQGKRMTSKTMEAEFEFVNETNKSTRAMAFELSEDRARLTRTDLVDGLRTQYVRCPKLMAG